MSKSERALNAARLSLRNYMLKPTTKRIWCYTDPGRRWLAEAYATAGRELNLAVFITELTGDRYTEEELATLGQFLNILAPEDLVISIFSDGIERRIPYFRTFPNLRAPKDFKGLSAVIRQRYDDEALLTHLTTDPASINEVIETRSSLAHQEVRVTSPGGTDITFKLMNGLVLPYAVGEVSRHAYLPPAELTFGIEPGSAYGRIVVDVTVGELAVKGEIIDSLGLVDKPVEIAVDKGSITKVSGGVIAERLAAHLFSLEPCDRVVVELGLGLSQGTPTGQIGPDECLQGTCHFGVGDDAFYGGTNPASIHLDLVLRDPSFEVQGRSSER